MDDTSKLIHLLEELGCHDFIEKRGELRVALPDGDNSTSVQIRLNEYLSVTVYTRNDYNDDYEYNDIFTFVQYVRKCNMTNAIKWICAVVGIEYEGEKLDYKKSETIKELKRFRPKSHKLIEHEILDENYMQNVEKYIIPEWIEEGIDANTQSLFEVFIDRKYKRWFFPIRNHEGDLISTKGRTFVDQFKLKGIMKFIYNPPLGMNDILFGYYLTQFHIKDQDEMVIFEGEKSVMKFYSMGYKNSVAVGKNGINPLLVKQIIKSPCKRVVLAYDKDVPMKVIQRDIDKIKHYKEVYFVEDKTGLLGEKDCPIDCGVDTWEYLYKTKRRGK